MEKGDLFYVRRFDTHVFFISGNFCSEMLFKQNYVQGVHTKADT